MQKKETNKAINQKLQLMAATCIAVQPSGPGRSGSIGRSRSASTSFGEFEMHALTIASWWSEVAGQQARSTSFSGSEVNCSSSVQTELSLACNNLWRNRENPVHFTKLCLRIIAGLPSKSFAGNSAIASPDTADNTCSMEPSTCGLLAANSSPEPLPFRGFN